MAEDPDSVFAYMFRSHAKGTTHPSSHVDVAVYFAHIDDGPAGDMQAVDKQISFVLALQRTLSKPVDVVVLNRASLDLRQNVLMHGKLLFCKDRRVLARFKQTHLRQCQDFIMIEPIFRHYRRKRIEEGASHQLPPEEPPRYT